MWLPIVCFLYFFLWYRSHGYLLGGAVVLGLFYFLYSRWDRFRKWPIGAIALGLAGLGLPALGLWQFLRLSDPGDVDHAVYACAFWNMLHGSTRYSIGDMDIFGTHANYTCVFWLPVHWLTGEIGLKAGKALCLLAAALLLLRRFRGNRQVASWGAVALLLSPPIASQFFFGFHPEFLAAPVLILAMAAYRENRLGHFLACTAVLAFTKEVFTLAIAGMLLIALVERRPWKWVLLPGFLCCLQMAAYWFVIVPHFAPEGNHLVSYLPFSAGNALSVLLRERTFFFAFHIFLPFLPLILALPKRYLLAPLPLMAFYAAFPDPSFQEMWRHYPFPLAILCVAGLVLERDLRILDGRILLACAVMSLLCYPLWRTVSHIPGGNLAGYREMGRIRAMIPGNASLLVGGPFTAHFAARKEVSDWVYRVKPMEEFEYVLLDGNFAHPSTIESGRLSGDIRTLSDSPAWTREYAKDGVYLFRRNPAP
ncbi:MAG: Protein of unknown function rane [Fibrobacteres bacterium]|nr:Protein of unknown function rane [Fibrobacterota bacterium]